MGEWYGEDLAYIHDVGFSGFVLGATPGILEILTQHGIYEGRVVDLGCGSGSLARELTGAGYRVLGIDISEEMIAIARSKAPEAEFRVGSMFEVKLPSCVAVTSIGEVLNYLFDPENSGGTLDEIFHRIYEALVPGGVFIFDLLEPGQVEPGNSIRSFTQGEDWVVLVEKEEDRERKTLTRRIVTFRRVGEHYRRSDEMHRVRLYDGPVVAAELRQAGFEVQSMGGYGQYHLPEIHPVFAARKPAQRPFAGED